MGLTGKAKRKHLNATECDELARNSHGPEALTRPHVVGCRLGDPSRGLYPRTPTKRPRRGKNADVHIVYGSNQVYYSLQSLLLVITADIYLVYYFGCICSVSLRSAQLSTLIHSVSCFPFSNRAVLSCRSFPGESFQPAKEHQ